jgi:hypothetical protein
MKPAKLHYLIIPLLSDNMYQPVSVQWIKIYSRSSVVRIHHRMWTRSCRFARHIEDLHVLEFSKVMWKHGPARMDASYVLKQEVLGRNNRLLSLVRHRPRWKRCIQQFFSCCVCIHYHGNVSTDPVSSNNRGIFTEPRSSNDKVIFTKPLPSNDRGNFTELLPSNDKEIFT